MTTIVPESGDDASRFTVYYQPIVELLTGRVSGVEAVLRLRVSDPGSRLGAHPGESDAGDATSPVAIWVLDRACAELAAYRTSRAERHLFVSVNFSAGQVADGSSVASVRRALARHGLPGTSLSIELPDTRLADLLRARSAIEQLRELGVSVALDDFGAEFSTLAYLARLPVDRIKLAPAFVASVESDPRQRLILEGVVTLAQDLGMSVVICGIESAHQMEAAIAVGGDFGQGYLLGRPQPGGLDPQWGTPVLPLFSS